jgi:uncharacterized protein with HEPN domain
MINAAMLKVIQDCGEGVLVLTEGIEETELLHSRLTRAEVRRQLALMASTLAALPQAARAAMPELDWAAWRATELALDAAASAQAEALWFAVRSLVPATLNWLHVYRQEQPGWFAFRP